VRGSFPPRRESTPLYLAPRFTWGFCLASLGNPTQKSGITKQETSAEINTKNVIARSEATRQSQNHFALYNSRVSIATKPALSAAEGTT